jgi:hypothetical protein
MLLDTTIAVLNIRKYYLYQANTLKPCSYFSQQKN